MIPALVVCYCIGLYLVFIKFRWVPLNLVTAALSASVGAIGMMVLAFSINYLQPWTTDTVVVQYTTPVQPRVPGRVIEVPVKNGTHCKKGTSSSRSIPSHTATRITRRGPPTIRQTFRLLPRSRPTSRR